MIPVDELRCCNLFDQLNDRELEEVAKLGTVEKRGAGSRVIAEGTNAGALYMLKEGRVAVRMSSRDGNEVLIDELGPGSVFGWSAVLNDQMFKAAIWVTEDATIVVLDGEKLRQLFEANNHIGYRVVRTIAGVTADRLEKLRARLVDQPFSGSIWWPPAAPRSLRPPPAARCAACPVPNARRPTGPSSS